MADEAPCARAEVQTRETPCLAKPEDHRAEVDGGCTRQASDGGRPRHNQEEALAERGAQGSREAQSSSPVPRRGGVWLAPPRFSRQPAKRARDEERSARTKLSSSEAVNFSRRCALG